MKVEVAQEVVRRQSRISSPGDLRAVLLLTIEGVLEGRVSVSQANAVSSLAAQVHSSISKEWDMRCYAAENLALEKGEVVRLLGIEKVK